jgi:hypothetical protein
MVIAPHNECVTFFLAGAITQKKFPCAKSGYETGQCHKTRWAHTNPTLDTFQHPFLWAVELEKLMKMNGNLYTHIIKPHYHRKRLLNFNDIHKKTTFVWHWYTQNTKYGCEDKYFCINSIKLAAERER